MSSETLAATRRGCNLIRQTMAYGGHGDFEIVPANRSRGVIQQTDLAETLCDLRHACHAAGLDWTHALVTAVKEYERERQG